MPIIKKILRWIILIGVFALPFVCLYVANTLFFPHTMGKNYAFRVIVEIIAFAWLVLALTDGTYWPCRSRILGAFAIFVILIGIADAHGVNSFKSFWGNYERMDGWITIAHTFLYTVIIASVLQTKKLWILLFQTTLGVSIFVSILGFLQVADIGLSGRISTTFGNPSYLSVYMLFNIFIAALLWAQIGQNSKVNKRIWPSLYYGAIIACDTLTLSFTGTRGTILGLIGGSLLALTLYAFSHDTPKRLKNLAVAAIALTVLLSALLYYARDTPFIHRIDIIQRLATTSLEENTAKARILNWGVAWQGIKERPILGWGQENYTIVFNKYYNPQLYDLEQWFDRGHNIIFDWWVAGGTLGLLSYLFIFAALFWTLWRSRTYTAAERSILTGLFFGYFIHNLFIFDSITSYILFGTIMGYLVWREREVNQAKPMIKLDLISSGSMTFMVVAAIILAGGTVYVLNVPALKQNQALIEAIIPKSDAMQNLSYFKKAISYGAYGTQEVREQLVKVAMKVATYSNIPNNTKQKYLNTAVNEMMQQEKISPLDAGAPLSIGLVEKIYGDYDHAAVALQKAHELAPSKQTILLDLGLNARARGDTAKALQSLKEAYDLAPEFLQARILYATEAITSGNDALADSLLAPIVSTGEAATQGIAVAYGQRKKFAKIISIWSARITAQPQDVQAYLTLAAAYYSNGNSPQAVTTLQMLAKNVPGTTLQAQTFINQINNARKST